MLGIFFEVLQQATTTNVSFDWGVIITALAPVSAIIITWLLQRKTTKDAAAELAKAHEQDKLAAIARQEQGKNELLAGQHEIVDAVNAQLMVLINARIKSLKEKIVAAGGKTNGDPPLTLENAPDQINKLETQLETLLEGKV